MATDLSDEAAGIAAIRSSVLNGINQLQSTNFFLEVDVEKIGKSTPSAKRIRRFLQEGLTKHDPDEAAERFEMYGLEGLPHLTYRDEAGTIIRFRAIPRKAELRKGPADRPIGVISMGVRRVQPQVAVREAVRRKAGRYGELGMPYVVAVNAIAEWDPDRDDLLAALFGDEQWIHTRHPDGRIEDRPGRARNGVWTRPAGPQNTRVSAVLAFLGLYPYSLASAAALLHENPWASFPLGTGLPTLPRVLLDKDGDRFVYQDGQSIASILGAPSTWPDEDLRHD